MIRNVEVRESAKRAGVRLWQVAMELGMAEATLTRKLRIELSPRDKALVLEAIEAIASRQDQEVEA